jgi:heme-degrading monooxygenase HmoA
MIAMQYTIRLADDYGAQNIRARVQQRYAMFDNMPGLAHKSYLFSPEDRLYAPFYIWADHDAARDFLIGDVFQNVSDTFSRPRVRTWNVICYDVFDPTLTPTLAVRESDAIAAESHLSELAETERAAHEKLRGQPGLHSHAVALDADRWELVRFSLWRDEAAGKNQAHADAVQTYEVLHLSTPPGGKA